MFVCLHLWTNRTARLTAMFLMLAVLAGCQSSPGASAPAGQAAASTSVALPEPAPELVGLGFLTGRWASQNPNKTVNREHWMSPQGKTVAGLFQQYRPDGAASFYEVTAIAVEPDGVKLYHRHLHRGLEIDGRRAKVDAFKLVSLEGSKAVFVPESGVAAGAGGIESMTYRADGPDRLVQELAFKPDSKEKNFVTVYTREQ